MTVNIFGLVKERWFRNLLVFAQYYVGLELTKAKNKCWGIKRSLAT
jgi:hypothetical protein